MMNKDDKRPIEKTRYHLRRTKATRKKTRDHQDDQRPKEIVRGHQDPLAATRDIIRFHQKSDNPLADDIREQKKC